MTNMAILIIKVSISQLTLNQFTQTLL